jgi:hypothetical protein
VHDHLVAVLVDARCVASEDHRQLLLRQADAAQRPDVVVVQRGGADLHRGPAVGDVRVRPVADLEAGERVVGVQAGGVGGEHAQNPAMSGSAAVIQARRRIHAPRSALFAFLEDLDQHWRLTDGVVERVGPSDGGARVRIRGPFGLRREATTRIDVATPDELAGTARVGAVTRATVSWRLEPEGEATAVALTVTVEEASRRDRLVLALGGRTWLRGALAAALERLDELAVRGELGVELAA